LTKEVDMSAFKHSAHRAHTRPAAGGQRAQRAATTAQRCVDLARFEPVMPLATRKVTELVSRGVVLFEVTRERVLLRRQERTASIDSFGRVEWSATPIPQPALRFAR
jgi:hypothetical protein